MRFSGPPGCFALVFAGFSVKTAEAGAIGPVEPAPSLAQQLQEQARVIKAYPHDESGRYHISQKLLDDFEATVNLILNNLSVFVDNYDTCQPILRELTYGLMISGPVLYKFTDYACRCQDQSFLWRLGKSYHNILYSMCEDAGPWRGASFGSFDALTRFLKSSAEALRATREMEVYHDVILPSDPEVFLGGQEDFTGPAEAAVLQTAKEVEEFKQKVCKDYEALADGVGKLFEQMIDELESILGDLEDGHRDSAYMLFKECLNASFDELLPISPDSWQSRTIGFKTSACREPSEVLALMKVRIFVRVLDFKLESPKMDHARPDFDPGLFSQDEEFRGAFDDGPPLVGNVMVGAPDEDSGEQSEFLARFETVLLSLRRWVYSLYKRLQLRSDDSAVGGRAREWLNAVERNLCSVLESIEEGDRKQRLYALARTFEHWDSIALNIERMLVMLYGTENLRRREGQPGHFSIKLRRVIGKVLGGGPSVKRARVPQRPEGACGDEVMDGQCGDVGFGSGDNCIRRMSGMGWIRGCRYVVIVLWLAAMAVLLAQW